MNTPFEEFFVEAAGDVQVHFIVGVQPSHWSRRGQDADIEAQRLFIQQAVAEKLQRECGEEA